MSSINEISNRTIFRILLSVSAFIGFAWLVFILKGPLVWIGTALFLAIAINPLVEKVLKWFPIKKRVLAVGLVFVLLLAGLTLVVYTIIPPLVNQTEDLISNLPEYVTRLQNSDSLVGRLAERYDLIDKVKANQSNITSRLSGAGVGIVQGIFGGLIATITIATLTFMMLLEGPGWLGKAWELMPIEKRAHRQKILRQMYGVVSGYVTGRLLIALIAAVTTTVALSLLGVPFAIPLGLMVGILDLMPMVGATLGAVVASTIALLQSMNAGIVMAVFFLIYQQLENILLVPLIDSRTVQLSPLLVIISAILGIFVGGLIGALVAIPVAACMQILVKDYIKRHLRV